MEPNQPNPYNFILDDKPKKHGLPLIKFGGSKKQRLLQIVIGGILLIILLVIVFSLIFSGGSNDTKQLYQIAASQKDIIDLTNLGSTKAANQQLINQSATINLVVTTQSNDTLSYLAKKGHKKPTKQIAQYRDSTYKKALDDALKNGKYDDSYQALLNDQLSVYRSKLQTIYNSTSVKSLKNQTSNDYSQLANFVASN